MIWPYASFVYNTKPIALGVVAVLLFRKMKPQDHKINVRHSDLPSIICYFISFNCVKIKSTPGLYQV